MPATDFASGKGLDSAVAPQRSRSPNSRYRAVSRQCRHRGRFARRGRQPIDDRPGDHALVSVLGDAGVSHKHREDPGTQHAFRMEMTGGTVLLTAGVDALPSDLQAM